MEAPASGIAATVRAADPDRYLATLYAPQARREALFALDAFNAEIAAVRDRISEPLPGEVRLQWWRDALSAANADATGGHPVAAALVRAIGVHDLPSKPFLDMLEARVFDLYDDPMPDRACLEGYCGETASALIQLGALVLDAEAARETAALAGHAGCAQAMTGLLRLLPIHRRRGQCYIPRDVLEAAGTSREALLAGQDREGVKRAVGAMAALAREHLGAFHDGAARLPASLRPAYLPLAPVPAYLNRVEAAGAGALDRDTGAVPPAHRHWIYLRRAVWGW